MTAATTPAAPGTSERYRILVVDDNEDMLELIRSTLQGHYDIITLSNPMDVYEIMDVFEPDLMILDIMMPKITGYQLIEMLRKSNSGKDLPVIILSAKSSAGEIKHGYKLGATLYLTKPFQPDRLVKNIETQFRVNPPAKARKTYAMDQMMAQLELKNAFRRGTAQLAGVVTKKENIVLDARRRLEEKILAEQKARRGEQ